MASNASSSGGDDGDNGGQRGHPSAKCRGSSSKSAKKAKAAEARVRRRGPGIAELERILREEEIAKMGVNNQPNQSSIVLQNPQYPNAYHHPQLLITSPPPNQMTQNPGHFTVPSQNPQYVVPHQGHLYRSFQVPPSHMLNPSASFQGHPHQNVISSWPMQQQVFLFLLFVYCLKIIDQSSCQIW